MKFIKQLHSQEQNKTNEILMNKFNKRCTRPIQRKVLNVAESLRNT